MVYVGTEGPLQKMFCKDGKPEENTNFTVPSQFDSLTGRPNMRQQTLITVDRIVRHYLEKNEQYERPPAIQTEGRRLLRYANN